MRKRLVTRSIIQSWGKTVESYCKESTLMECTSTPWWAMEAWKVERTPLLKFSTQAGSDASLQMLSTRPSWKEKRKGDLVTAAANSGPWDVPSRLTSVNCNGNQIGLTVFSGRPRKAVFEYYLFISQMKTHFWTALSRMLTYLEDVLAGGRDIDVDIGGDV